MCALPLYAGWTPISHGIWTTPGGPARYRAGREGRRDATRPVRGRPERSRPGRSTARTITARSPFSAQERAELLADLRDLGVYQALLEQRAVRGVVVDCAECQEPHYHDWALLRASLEQLLNDGRMRPHEPAFDPNPSAYVCGSTAAASPTA